METPPFGMSLLYCITYAEVNNIRAYRVSGNSKPKKETAPVMIRTFLMGFMAIILLSLGQTSLKVGLNQIGGFSLTLGISGFLKLLETPWIIAGFACYGLSSILWLDVLSKLEYSLAFPMIGLTYVFTLLIGRFFFQEIFGWWRVLGVGLIVFGILCLVRSSTAG